MKKLLGYTLYLSKQASKVMNRSKIVVKSDKMPTFDATTELWVVHEDIECGKDFYTKVYNLSKEAILSIEYDYENLEGNITLPDLAKTDDEENKQKSYSWKGIGSSIDVPTPMYNTQDSQEDVNDELYVRKAIVKF